MEKFKKNVRQIKYNNLLWIFMGLVLLIMVLIYGAIYFWYYQKSIHETTEKNSLIMQVAQRDIDGQIKVMTEITQILWRDYDLLVALSGESPYHKYKLIQKLSSYSNIYDNLLDIATFDNHSDFVYSSLGAIDQDSYFSKFVNLGIDSETLLELVRTTNSATFYGFLPATLIGKQMEYQVALYIDPISDTRKVVYLVNQNAFVSPIQNILQEQKGVFFVLDAKGNPMLSLGINQDNPDEESLADWAFPFLPSSEDVQVYMQQRTIYLTAKSNVSGFRYVILSHQNVFQSGLQTIRMAFLTSIAFLVALGIAISTIFSRVSYKPIMLLRDAILEPGARPSLTGWQDLDSITEHFREVYAHLKQTEDCLLTDWGFLYNSLICGLVNSTSSYYFNQSAYQRVHIELSKQWSQVALLQAEQSSLSRIQDMVGDAARAAGIFSYMSDNNGYKQLIIVFHGDDKPSLTQVIQTVSEQLSKAEITFRIGIGQAVEEIHLIRFSFSQAFSALQEKTDQIVSFYRQKPSQRTKGLFQALRQQLAQSILSRDIDTAEKLIRELFAESSDYMGDTFLYSDLIYLLLVTARAENAPDTIISNALYSVHRDQGEMINAILYLVRTLCERLPEAVSEQNDPFIQEVTDYIRAHHIKSSLSVQHIADHFQVSVSYLDRYIKNSSGKTVFIILDGMRMERAMQLLVETELSIREIVDQSGYGDVNHFTKKFKRTTGLTPSQYRRVQQEI